MVSFLVTIIYSVFLSIQLPLSPRILLLIRNQIPFLTWVVSLGENVKDRGVARFKIVLSLTLGADKNWYNCLLSALYIYMLKSDINIKLF